MQERRNSSALAMELHLSCTNPLRWSWDCLIFIMAIPMLVRWHLYIETASRSTVASVEEPPQRVVPPTEAHNPWNTHAICTYMYSASVSTGLGSDCINEDFGARSKYPRHGCIITSHSMMWDVITHPCLRYLLLAYKSFSVCSMYRHGSCLPEHAFAESKPV